LKIFQVRKEALMMPEEYLAALLTLPNIDDDLIPIVSPDGKWVAWTWFQVGPAADVFVTSTDGSTAPIRLTETTDNTYLISWAPDSRAVLVVQDEDGNERDQIFRIDLERPFKMIPLTEARPNYFIQGGQLHPNGKWLVYAANFDVASGAEIEETWVYRHDLESGERQVLAKPQKAVRMVPQLNRQGTHILYNRKDLHPAGYQTWLVDIEGQNDRELFNFGNEVKTYASWHPDGEQILVMAETPTHRRLGLAHIDGRKIRWLLDDPARDIEAAYIPFGSRAIAVIENIQGRLQGVLLDPETSDELKWPEIPGNLIPLAPVPRSSGNAQNDDWIGFYYSARQPSEIVHFYPKTSDPKNFTDLARVWERTQLTANDLYPAEDFNWQSTDGLRIHGWLYRTPGKAKGTIVYVHGGPTYHSRDALNAQIQFFVRQGFNVLDPNYRGSTGYGMAFREAIIEDGWGGREQEDIRTGIEALLKAEIAQKGEIGITGTSYGGYSSWWAITHFPRELVAAAAPICGMTDLVVDYETTRPDIRPYSEEMMGGNPAEVPERYFERSPIHFVNQIRGKLLIVQGAQDPNVTPKNVADVVKLLDTAAIPYEVLTFEDEGHGISKTHNQRTLLLRLVDFFEQAFSNTTN
jgi:dipeptidyl aminopeptidase/acylaminoacyl peptidase